MRDGSYGSCWAFSATVTVEAYNNEEFEIATFKIVLQDNQFSIAFQK